jgi:hypothetical protein
VSTNRTDRRRPGATGLADRAPFGRTPEPPTDTDARRVVRTVAASAHDAGDCALLLEMLGLDPATGLAPADEVSGR